MSWLLPTSRSIIFTETRHLSADVCCWPEIPPRDGCCWFQRRGLRVQCHFGRRSDLCLGAGGIIRCVVRRGMEHGAGDMDSDDILDGIANLLLNNYTVHNTVVLNEVSREPEFVNFPCRSVAAGHT